MFYCGYKRVKMIRQMQFALLMSLLVSSPFPITQSRDLSIASRPNGCCCQMQKKSSSFQCTKELANRRSHNTESHQSQCHRSDLILRTLRSATTIRYMPLLKQL
ncbi:hypothetical protein KIL84_015568 [Mauremys mutica]|uniref:Secreted protein n=1 Tax=Mauremys mutica TaxID=74926 RepID=A0A9D4AS13_9SAUR|nr:hypothetical protein KIL84_015568 [Mauremys mutica]